MTPTTTNESVMTSIIFRMSAGLPLPTLLNTVAFTLGSVKTILTMTVFLSRQLTPTFNAATGATSVPWKMPCVMMMFPGMFVLTVACMQLPLSLLITDAWTTCASRLVIGRLSVKAGTVTCLRQVFGLRENGMSGFVLGS